MQISREQIGRTLIWLGVLTWVPYTLLTIAGKSLPILPFLTVHLAGVIGGTKLRRRNISGSSEQSRSITPLQRRISNALLLIGIITWGVYFLMKSSLGEQVEIMPFLIIHLSGIFGGILLRFNFNSMRVFRNQDSQSRDELFQ